jgi:hypothetical protein
VCNLWPHNRKGKPSGGRPNFVVASTVSALTRPCNGRPSWRSLASLAISLGAVVADERLGVGLRVAFQRQVVSKT